MMSRQEQVRREALLQLSGLRPMALDAEALVREATKNRLNYTRDEFARELEFLADDGLLIRITEPGTTVRLYRIHAAGVRHYEQTFAA